MIKNFFFCAFCLIGQKNFSEGQPLIRFHVPVKDPVVSVNMTLYISGDFNQWNPADNSWKMQYNPAGYFELEKHMVQGQHAFKLTQGNWETVECNAGGGTVDNHYVQVDNDTTITIEPAAWQNHFKAQPKAHTASPQVSIISEKFQIPQLGRERRVWIYLPKDYQHSDRKYPVLYMHDGQNLFDNFTAGYGEWEIDEMMNQMPAARQCIIVAVDHGGEHRISEYDPYDSKYGKGEGDAYADFMAHNLKPYIDKHYRTLADARHTAVAGSSMGGLISLYIAVKYPKVFGSAGVFSPALWIAPPIYDYVEQHYPADTASSFYFVCGDAESDSMVADMQKMADLLKSRQPKGDSVPVVIIKGAHHNEKQWHDDFPAFYQWLLSKFGIK